MPSPPLVLSDTIVGASDTFRARWMITVPSLPGAPMSMTVAGNCALPAAAPVLATGNKVILSPAFRPPDGRRDTGQLRPIAASFVVSSGVLVSWDGASKAPG